MLRFYWSLIRELPAALRDVAEAWGFWIWTIGAPALVLLNPQIDRWINTPQFSRRFVLVPIGLSVVYVMLRANYRRFEKLVGTHTAQPITRDDWMEMAKQFDTLRDRPLPALWEPGGLTATWHQVGERESWSVDGGTPKTRREFEALCKRAGTMLIVSPKVAALLSPKVRPTKSETFELLASLSAAVCVSCSAEEL